MFSRALKTVPKRTDGGSSPQKHRVRNSAWTKRQTASPEARREYEQERLIVGAFESIADAMESAGLSYADVARQLGCSRSHITKLFSGHRNATLRTIADLAWACRSRALVSLEAMKNGAFVDGRVPLDRPRVLQVGETAKATERRAPVGHRRAGRGARRKA
jgi:transcriptional regulator with XRE-family HTH domain